jgi:DNA modification methylase/rubredoxin
MASDILFSDDYLDQLNPQKQVEQGPVTVFGLTFKNDEERRQYFREELRRRLPELRKIEGFPIGEDDDIINLSDPPYYTACPNPWLNDFIAQWEEEKKELQREGKRKADFEVKEPYASDVSEGKNNPIYMAHSYHTKVPHPAIMRYILHYTQPGDIVLDGFCGTGMTGVASNMCGNKAEVDALDEKGVLFGTRHCICSDLSPMASLISASYNLPFNPQWFKKKAMSILEQVEKEWGWMYETEVNGKTAKVNFTVWSDDFSCPSCGGELNYWDAAVDLENEIIRDDFECPHCGTHVTKKDLNRLWVTKYDELLKDAVPQIHKTPILVNYTLNGKRGENAPTEKDIDLIERTEEYDISNLLLAKLPDGEKTTAIEHANNVKYLHQLYTKRAYIYLSRVKELAEGEPLLLPWITSIIMIASRLYRFRLNRKNGIMTGTLYLPSFFCECNPYFLLKGKINGFVDSAYHNRGNSTISVMSATKMSEIAANSIDYIFVDPPFGANIMYSELSSIWENWLKVKTDNKEEAIINKTQSKSLFEYQQLMNASFREFYRVLKPNKWITIEFSNTSASVWNSIQNALQGVGFVIVNVASIDKQQGSFNAVTSTTAVKQDLVITCYKPSDDLTDKFLQLGGSKENVWDFIDEHLLHLPVHIEKGNATTSVVERSPKILYDRLISYYVQKGFAIPMDAQEFQKGLYERYAERDGMFFTATQAAEYEEKKLKAPEFVPMGIMVSDEANGIEWLKNELRNNPQTRQDIFTNWTKAIAGVRKGDVIPELDTLLEENFIQNEDGTWRLANVNDDVDLEKLRTKALLKEFKLYLEVCRKPRGKLKDVRVEAVRAGFKQCYSDKNFADIILVGDRIPQNLLTEDEVLLQYYDIASSKV